MVAGCFFSEVFTLGGYKYDLVNERLPWFAARSYCEDRGSYLTSVMSREENEFLAQFTSPEFTGFHL